jgi:hypothetical protein
MSSPITWNTSRADLPASSIPLRWVEGVGVGLSPEERERMKAHRPLWATFWLRMLLPGNRGFRRNPPGTIEAQATHLLALLA